MNPIRPTPKVGDTLYSLNIGNEARNRPQVLTPVQVMKVGRKYFTCSEIPYLKIPHLHREYHLDDWREKTDFCRNSQLYASPQEYKDESEAMQIRAELRRVFDSWGTDTRIPVAALREIREIVKPYAPLDAKR